jgi:hypothetical protein
VPGAAGQDPGPVLEDDKLDDKERFEAYRDGGVRDWVRNTLRRMTNRAVAKLKGIGQKDTYTPEDGSGELNMGKDIEQLERSREEGGKRVQESNAGTTREGEEGV